MSGMELVEFLRERLAEDEAVARAASPGPWHVNAESTEVLAVDDITVADGFALSGPQLRATTDHIARHDPARVLADVAAKRRILAARERIDRSANDGEWSMGYSDAIYEVLRALALPYAEHPDYRHLRQPN